MLELDDHCPAAQLLQGPPASGPAVICGVLNRRTEGIDRILGATAIPVLQSAREDASTLIEFCCGEGVPVASPKHDGEHHPHYTNCPIWQAAKLDGWEGEEEPAEIPMEAFISGEADVAEFAGPAPVDPDLHPEEAQLLTAPVGALPGDQR